jgi:hypothetical protein
MSVSILVVDDEPDVPELFRQRFRREARQGTYVLHFAASGEEALDQLAGGVEPELIVILSDINMPGMDGLELLRAKLASVMLQFGAYAGGAHPNNWRGGVLWDMPADKPATLEDFLADPAKAVLAIAALCKAIGEREDWGLFSDADFAAVVGDAKSWAVDKDAVTIMFDPYSVAPYVAGPHDCRLSYAELKDWLRPGGFLPPQ